MADAVARRRREEAATAGEVPSIARSTPARTAVLLDPHPLWLGAVKDVLAQADIEVVGEASRPEDAVRLVVRLRPALLIAEISPSEGVHDGLSSLREAHRQLPELKILVLSADSRPDRIDAAFEAGATAYVVKTADADDLATAIRQAFRHSMYFAPDPAAPTVVLPDTAGELGLTARELEVLALAARGHSNSQLAKMFWVTEQTVKFHLSNVYRKLGVANRTEASRWAQQHGLLAEPSAGAEPDSSAGL